MVRSERVIQKQRINHTFIMNDFKMRGKKLQYIQQCRLYLHIATFAKFSTLDGTQLKENAFHKQIRPSKLNWPHQVKPTKQAWTEWRKYLCTLLQHRENRTSPRQLKQKYRLGAWISTHQIWTRMTRGIIILHRGQF